MCNFFLSYVREVTLAEATRQLTIAQKKVEKSKYAELFTTKYRFVFSKATSTLCWIAFYAVVKNTPTWCEQKWPKTAAIFPPESNRSSSLLTSFRFSSLFTLLKKVSRKPIQYVTIHFQDRSSAASLRHKNRSEIGVLCVNENPIRYVFGAGTRAIRYSVEQSLKIASDVQTSS